MITFKQLQEKAASQQQQKLMGLALAYKRGEVPEDEVSATVKGLADRMSEKDLEDFASTKHKGLPKKVAVKESTQDRDLAKKGLVKFSVKNRYKKGQDVDFYMTGTWEKFYGKVTKVSDTELKIKPHKPSKAPAQTYKAAHNQ